jgi:Tol biopolymer transport system component
VRRHLALGAAALVAAAGVTIALTQHDGALGSGPLITFWSGRSGHPGVWAMRPDGSHLTLLTRFPENAKRGVLSPDGRTVAFDGASAHEPVMVDFDVQTMALDGSRRRTIAGTRAREIDPRWSPDGRLISYSRQPGNAADRSSLWTVRPDGSNPRRLGPGAVARWSRDGRRIAYALFDGRQSDLFLMDADGSHRRRLTSTAATEEPAAWSPDSRRLLFTRFTPRGRIGVLDLRTRRVTVLTSGARDETAADWSPDGSRILFTSDGHVAVMRADGIGRRNLTRGAADDEATSWR